MVKGALEALLEKSTEHPFLLTVAAVLFVAGIIHSHTLCVELLTVMLRHLRRQAHHLAEAYRELWNDAKKWGRPIKRL